MGHQLPWRTRRFTHPNSPQPECPLLWGTSTPKSRPPAHLLDPSPLSSLPPFPPACLIYVVICPPAACPETAQSPPPTCLPLICCHLPPCSVPRDRSIVPPPPPPLICCHLPPAVCPETAQSSPAAAAAPSKCWHHRPVERERAEMVKMLAPSSCREGEGRGRDRAESIDGQNVGTIILRRERERCLRAGGGSDKFSPQFLMEVKIKAVPPSPADLNLLLPGTAVDELLNGHPKLPAQRSPLASCPASSPIWIDASHASPPPPLPRTAVLSRVSLA